MIQSLVGLLSHKYPVVLTLHDTEVGALVGQSTYPELGCEGRLELREVQTHRVILKESIVKGKGISRTLQM